MKLVNWLNPLVNWLWDNKEIILQQDDNDFERPGDRFGFEIFYPEYGGIPAEISENLLVKQTDILNRWVVFSLRNYKEKQQFCQKICDELTNSTVIFEDTFEFIKE